MKSLQSTLESRVNITLWLRFLPRPDNYQRDAPSQDQPSEHGRYGNMFLLFRGRMNRTHVQHFFLMSVIKPLVSQRQAAKNNQKYPNPKDWFHSVRFL